MTLAVHATAAHGVGLIAFVVALATLAAVVGRAWRRARTVDQAVTTLLAVADALRPDPAAMAVLVEIAGHFKPNGGTSLPQRIEAIHTRLEAGEDRFTAIEARLDELRAAVDGLRAQEAST